MNDQPGSIVPAAGHHRPPARVSVSAQLDRAGVSRLRGELIERRRAGAVYVRLDLSLVSRCDHDLAPVLAWSRIQLRGRGGELIITGASEQVRSELAAAAAAMDRYPGWHADWPDALTFPPNQTGSAREGTTATIFTTRPPFKRRGEVLHKSQSRVAGS